MKNTNTTVGRYLKACSDLLFPRTCIVCGRKLMTDERHLCMYCRMDLPMTYFWKRSHNPMADRFNSVLQKGLEEAWNDEEPDVTEHERYAFACALFYFNSDADYRRIPYQLKYQGNIPAGRHFGQILGARLAESPCFRDADVVIPVPLHWRRKWKRGYNQAEIIAREVASFLNAPMRDDILTRKRSTKTQTALTITEKASNVESAFAVRDPETLKDIIRQSDGHILLIDDVFTSGATLYACFTALRNVLPPKVRISVATLGYVGR